MPPLRIGDILSPRMKALHIEFATRFREEPVFQDTHVIENYRVRAATSNLNVVGLSTPRNSKD